jgi:hypothetical protein
MCHISRDGEENEMRMHRSISLITTELAQNADRGERDKEPNNHFGFFFLKKKNEPDRGVRIFFFFFHLKNLSCHVGFDGQNVANSLHYSIFQEKTHIIFPSKKTNTVTHRFYHTLLNLKLARV